jgi:integrase/recombinase XerD
MSYSYHGNLSEYIKGLIESKQLLGYPYLSSAKILKHFDSYCMEHFPSETTITRDMGLRWATLKENEHQNYLSRRISPVRQLAKYMQSIGIEAYIIPSKIPNKQIRYVPHIYTAAELAAFFKSIDSCRISPYSKVRHLVIPVFFRLLYCCGLRSSETRLLHFSDVDHSKGTVYIRKSKGHKDRLVYLSDELVQLCKTYDERVKNLIPDREAFFPNQNGQFYDKSVVDCWFHEFWDSLGIAKNYSGNSPRVHDFRYPNLNKIQTF